ncbi:unnamed protein product [Angiostrongylus costaricensis]|uniref:Elf-1_N domain-containing protein n=1 Tax=Angiostrongylus costaricensis TaxID=334426 RepID=A0A0R3PPH2_ANGCS|nr:unnamed protein product [Angiostrongylus costaricensis]
MESSAKENKGLLLLNPVGDTSVATADSSRSQIPVNGMDSGVVPQTPDQEYVMYGSLTFNEDNDPSGWCLFNSEAVEYCEHSEEVDLLERSVFNSDEYEICDHSEKADHIEGFVLNNEEFEMIDPATKELSLLQVTQHNHLRLDESITHEQFPVT